MTAAPSTLAADQAAKLRALIDASQPAVSSSPAAEQPRLAPLVAISSGKGGVGKTTLSVNLSVALRRRGLRPTLIDADLGAANADVLCGLTPTLRLDDVDRPGVRPADLAVTAPGGFRLVPGAVGWALAEGYSNDGPAAVRRAADAVSPASDIVLIDTAAGVGRGVVSLATAADALLIVLTPEPTSMTDAYALLKSVARSATPGRVLVVVNAVQSRREAGRAFGRFSRCAEKFLGLNSELLGVVADDARVSVSIRRGKPIVLAKPRSKAARAIAATAERLAETMLESAIPIAASSRSGR
ncbi:MAG: P-loop NTPase [Planctomycetota bacterium]